MKNWMIIPALLLWTFSACDDQVKVSEACGDGFVDPGEQCDGAELQGQTCATLGHYQVLGTLRCLPTCLYDLSECGGRCGDNTVDAADGEQCDGENLNGQTCQNLGYTGGTISCTAECRFDISACQSACGNGHLEPGEECEDGARVDGDGCSSECRVEPGWTCDETVPPTCVTSCGDSVAAGDEECDGEDLRGYVTCQMLDDIPYYGGTLSCLPDCTFDMSSCLTAGYCGDHVIQAASGEVCDRSALGDETCETLGRYPGALKCADDCQAFSMLSCGGRCGDGVAQVFFGEQCDGDEFRFDQNGDGHYEDSCEDFGFYEGVLACDTDCRTPILTGCSLFCGDGIRQDAHGEACDGADLGGITCGQLGFAGGSLSCDASCGLVTTGCATWSSVTAGVGHTCALSTAGAVYCWGDNDSGQLGDGTTTDRTRPVAVTGLGSGVTVVAAGAHHTCAVQNGNLRCWGQNVNGQLGNGGTANSPLPVAVSGMQTADVQMVSAGAHHTCALKGDNPFCWGGNTYGQLGTGNTSPSLVPAAVTGLINLREIVAGGEFTCGIVEAISTVRCWGRNDSGQVGDASVTPVITSPQVVAGLTNDYASFVFLGATHACLTSVSAMNSSKQFYCWGSNALGQVGNNGTANANTAQLIWWDSTSYSPFAGSSSNVTIVSRPFGIIPGTYAWGDNQAQQILAGGAAYYNTPQQRDDFSQYNLFAPGAAHVCATRSGGMLWCWGHNDQGQLGDGTTTATTAAAPVQVQGP